MSKRTPGPWRWDSSTGTVWWGDRFVADVERDEDGPMIASAPELLETCKEALELLEWVSETTTHGWINRTIQRLHEAIAKVEGHE